MEDFMEPQLPSLEGNGLVISNSISKDCMAGHIHGELSIKKSLTLVLGWNYQCHWP